MTRFWLFFKHIAETPEARAADRLPERQWRRLWAALAANPPAAAYHEMLPLKYTTSTCIRPAGTGWTSLVPKPRMVTLTRGIGSAKEQGFEYNWPITAFS